RLGRAEHWRLPEGTLVDQPRQNGVFSATITAAMCSPCRGEVWVVIRRNRNDGSWHEQPSSGLPTDPPPSPGWRRPLRVWNIR
ncbi:MAG: hypothetical protein ACR2JY_03280, partial [Chloroflexota bacterium]